MIETRKKIKKCPFCGGKAVLEHGEMFGHKTAFVYCISCHAKTATALEGVTIAFLNIPSRYISIEECEKKVIEKWNSRRR